MIKRRREKSKEYAKNLFLLVLAVAVVIIFFNLDIIRKGESVFSKTADKKLKFTGDVDRGQFTKKELSAILKFAKKYDALYDEIIIKTSKQDSYRKLTQNSEILFDIHITMTDGSTLDTPTRRIQRKKLASEIVNKLNKDFLAYEEVMKKGDKIKSLVNTM